MCSTKAKTCSAGKGRAGDRQRAFPVIPSDRSTLAYFGKNLQAKMCLLGKTATLASAGPCCPKVSGIQDAADFGRWPRQPGSGAPDNEGRLSLHTKLNQTIKER